MVSGVQDGGPADDAGIERGDVILASEGAPIDDSNQLRNQVAALEPGTRANLTILHDGKERSVTAALG